MVGVGGRGEGGGCGDEKGREGGGWKTPTSNSLLRSTQHLI